MREILSILSIYLFHFFIGTIKTSELNLCDQYNQNPSIKVAVRLGDYTVFRFADQKVYRIKNFSFKNQEFSFGEITNITDEWNIKDDPSIGSFPVNEITAFPVNYFKNGTVTQRIVHIIHERNEDIDQLFSHQTLHGPNLTQVIDTERYSLLIYKYKPEPDWTQGYDPLTLVNLMAKFPDTETYKHLKAILGFPLNNPNLPMRLFVYYSEQPTSSKHKGQKFKRHVMIADPIKYLDSSVEMNWVHDNPSGRCFELNIPIESAFHLTDYHRTDNGFTFNIIEFSANHYFVRKVTMAGKRVEPKLQYLKIGPIGSIFGCKTTIGDLPTGLIRGKKRIMRYTTTIVFAWLLIVLLTALTAFVSWKWEQLNRQWNELTSFVVRRGFIPNTRRRDQRRGQSLPPPTNEEPNVNPNQWNQNVMETQV